MDGWKILFAGWEATRSLLLEIDEARPFLHSYHHCMDLIGMLVYMTVIVVIIIRYWRRVQEWVWIPIPFPTRLSRR
jgi:hypothetical protein